MNENNRRLLVTVRAASARWARDGVLGKLNQAIREAAATHGWIYVGDVASQFRTHGECAPDHQRWFRTEEDARNIQGPIDFGLSQLSAKDLMVSKGTLHPEPGLPMTIRYPFAVGRSSVASKGIVRSHSTIGARMSSVMPGSTMSAGAVAMSQG